MKHILYSLPLLLGLIACEADLPKANADLYQVESLTATAGDEQATLTWTPSAQGTPTAYHLSWTAGTGGIDGGEQTLDKTATSIRIQHLVNDVNYTFSIQARYANRLSGKISATTTPKNLKFPVTHLMARAGDTQVRLTWKKPATDQLTAYQITIQPGNQTITITDPATESYTVENLTNEQAYTFSITCLYPQGNSEAITQSAVPGLITPILIAETSLVLHQSCTFEYNEMYFNLDDIQSIHWNFGDGTTSTQTRPTHSYNTQGTYTITLTITYAGGTTDSGSIHITVTGYTWSSIEVGGYIKVSGAVFSPDGRTVYLPTSTPHGDVVAIDIVTGHIRWSYPIPTVTYGGGPLVDPTDGTIYQCGTDSKVYAIHPDGTTRWITSVDGPIGAFPALADNGTLYGITNAGTLFALNTAAAGAEQWKQTIDGVHTGSAVVVGKDGTIYAGTNKGLYAYTPSGTLKWSNPTLNVTERGAMAMNGPTLYVALKAGQGLAAIDITNGSVQWNAPTNGDAYCPIVDPNGNIYFTEKGISPTFNIYALHPNGTPKWTVNAGAALTYAGLALADNGIVYGGTQGKISGNYRIFGLNTADGSFAMDETSATHQIMVGAAIGPDKRLYLGTITTNNIGYLNAYEIHAGLETASWSVRGGNPFGTNQQP